MSSQKFLNKGEVYNPLLPWLGEGLLTAQGNIYWFNHLMMKQLSFNLDF